MTVHCIVLYKPDWWSIVLALSYLRSLPEKTPQLEMCDLQRNCTKSTQP